VPPALSDVEAAISWVSAQSIDLQVVSPWLDVIGDDLAPAQGAAWCRLLNDTTAEDVGGRDALGAFAALPLGDGAAAAVELARAVEVLGFHGGAITSQVAGVDLDEASLDPLFEAAQSLDVPLFMHPFRVIGSGRLRPFFLANVCGNPFDTTVAAMRLFFSGTLERWPGVKIILAHAGGTLPFLAGRAAHASTSVPMIDKAIQAPSELLDRFYYDTVLHDRLALGFVAQRVGVDRMVVGTDAPFPMLIDPVIDHVRESLNAADLGPDAFATVTNTTAQRLLSRKPA
jgi:aminocarboxymuconate-semialdehyde decarboxylase